MAVTAYDFALRDLRLDGRPASPGVDHLAHAHVFEPANMIEVQHPEVRVPAIHAGPATHVSH
jgi:hypothetical protein